MFLSADGYQRPILINPALVAAVTESTSLPGAIEIYAGSTAPLLVAGTLDHVLAQLGIEL